MKIFKTIFVLTWSFAVCLLSTLSSLAADATFSWSPNNPAPPGYKIYYGTSPGSYSNTEIINNSGLSSFLIEKLAIADWYFVMTSFNSSGIESDYSTEVSKKIN